MIYLSSDSHYWHNNVIKYCDRPFTSVEEMNEAMVRNWNSVVKPEDKVYYLGDFSLAFRAVETYSFRLNGEKYLVPGNHDFCHSYHKKSRKEEGRANWIQKYRDYGWNVLPEKLLITLNDEMFKMCHHPYSNNDGVGDKYAKWRPVDYGTTLLCGHVHEAWKTKRTEKGTLQINVGVDVWDYKPVSIEQIFDLISKEKA